MRKPSRTTSALPRRGRPVIQSAARAVQVLVRLARTPEGQPLAQLSAEMGLPSVTVLRLLQTLCDEGFVQQEAPRGRYRMSSRFWLRVAAAFPDVRAVQRDIQDTLAGLARETGATAFLAFPVPASRSMVIGAVAVPSRLLVAAPEAGLSVPMHALAAGKCFLASLPPAALQAWLQGELPALTEHTLTARSGLRRELREVRRQGYATSREEHVIGLWGLAVPVLDDLGEFAAALQVTAPLLLSVETRLPRRLPRVREAAAALAARCAPFGGRPQ